MRTPELVIRMPYPGTERNRQKGVDLRLLESYALCGMTSGLGRDVSLGWVAVAGGIGFLSAAAIFRIWKKLG